MPKVALRWAVVLAIPCLAALLLLPVAYPDTPKKSRSDLNKALKVVDAKTLKEHLDFLASPDMEGRESGSAGAHKAAMYIAEHYEKCGFAPKGTDGFFQPFGQAGQRGELKDANYVRVGRGPRPQAFEYDRQFKPAKFSSCGVVAGDVVFAGYGITAAEYGYDDYSSLTVDGKIVVVLDHEPREADPASPFDGANPTKYSDLRVKAETAKEKGAKALLVVRDAPNHPGETGFPADDELGWPPSGDAVGIPVAYLSEEAAAAIASTGGRKNWATLQKKMDESLKTEACELKGCAVALRVADKGPVLGGQKNVVAFKPGTDEALREQYVIISAHYDHVGRGSAQTSRGGIGKIHCGSDDNASGTSGLLELASSLVDLDLRRSVLLINFDGEEKGLLGSKHFAGAPTVPLDKIVTILNIDMISRNGPAEIFVGGIGLNKRLDEVLTDVSGRYKVTLKTDGMDQYLKRSDQWSLMEKGVPGLFFFGGMHPDYHTAGDTTEKANPNKMKLLTQVALVFLYEVGNGDVSPR